MNLQQERTDTMEAVQIGSQWYVVRWHDKAVLKLDIISGPYPEEWQAVSVTRLREID